MVPKFKSIEEGLTMLEEIDAQLSPRINAEDLTKREYEQLLTKINQRKAVIAQMNKLREQKPLVESASLTRIKQIYRKNQDVMVKIAEKQNQILKRLKDREKSLKKNKNFPY
jgi:hypothetical protein